MDGRRPPAPGVRPMARLRLVLDRRRVGPGLGPIDRLVVVGLGLLERGPLGAHDLIPAVGPSPVVT